MHADLQRRVRRERQDSMRQGRPRRDGDVRDAVAGDGVAVAIAAAADDINLDGVAAAAVATAAVAVAAAALYVSYHMLVRRLQLYLVGDNLGHHTHDHDQVSAGSSHTALPPATHAAHITSLTNLHAGPLLLFAATARITRRRISTQTMPSGARARTRSPSTPATTQPSRRASPQLAPSLASRTMVA